MVNRNNYLSVRNFLAYQTEVMQRDSKTVAMHKTRLAAFLHWCDEKSFSEASAIRPVYPKYLLGLKCTDGDSLSNGVVERYLRIARTFLTWLRLHHREYRPISPEWIDTLQPPRMADEIQEPRKIVTLDMVRALLAIPDNNNLVIRRDKAAAAFLFLSGVRGTAFCTLRLQCIEIEARLVKQYASLGVETKNRKSMRTRLLEIPDLLAVVKEWDEQVRSELSPSGYWYPPIELNTIAKRTPGKYRTYSLSHSLGHLFTLAGLEPLSAHKFRHGHAVYGLTHSNDVADLKAVSLNLGHKSLTITDSIYSVLTEDDVQARIAKLGQSESEGLDERDVEGVVRAVIKQLKKKHRGK